jgi:UDP-N-acetylglucosamine transferase subunit ALG13
VIFVTVGSSAPFDRLIRAVDEWAGLRGRADVFAQIGSSRYRPQHMDYVARLNPSDFGERIQSSKIIVAHAGMGSIIMALEIGKPIIVIPRRAHLGETRNDHQLATAKEFEHLQGIIVAFDEQQLVLKLDQSETSAAAPPISAEASPRLISTVRTFIRGIETAERETLKKGRKTTSGD